MGRPPATALHSAGSACGHAAVMSGAEPGSTSETHKGAPSGADTGDPVAGDQCAVRYRVCHALGAATVQHRTEVGGVVCEDVDALVQVVPQPSAGGAPR